MTVLIRDSDHFLELSSQFDNQHNTTTLVFTALLSEINSVFFKKSYNYSMQQIVDSIFEHNDTVYNDDPTLDVDHTVKLYTFYNLVRDIQAGNGIAHPLNIHYFGPNRVALAPGHSRMSFAYQYHNPVGIVLTDYTNTLTLDSLGMSTLNGVLEIPDNTLAFTSEIAVDGNPRNIYNITKCDTPYKQCIHQFTARAWGNSHQQDTVLYEKRNNKVFVDGMQVMYEYNGVWWFDI